MVLYKGLGHPEFGGLRGEGSLGANLCRYS